jgi:uncharacterized protein (TIGR02246 family)
MGVEDEVRAIAAAWDEALVRNDAPAIASFMSDDWVYVGANGITSKADIIDWISTGRLTHHSMDVVGTDRVAATGDSVLVTARKASSGTWDGAEYSADEWISEVYVRVDGRWRCALSHKTPASA